MGHIIPIILLLLKITFSQPQTTGLPEIKMNVILFFAQITPGDDYNNNTGINFLNFQEKTKLKYFSPMSGVDATLDELIREAEGDQNRCNDMLKSALASLISYCQNVLKMTAVFGSLPNTPFFKDVRFQNAAFRTHGLETRINPNLEPQKNLYANGGNPFSDVQPLPHQDIEIAIQNEAPDEDPDCKIGEKIPLLNAFPKDMPKFNDINPWRQKRRVAENFAIEPEHTEVFKIRIKREDDKPSEIQELPRLREYPRSNSWNFGSMISAFFDKMLNEDTDIITAEDRQLLHPNIETINRAGFFETVQKTLNVAFENGEGFFMGIAGGNLSEIASPYTPFIQGVKHVVENTNETNTLIAVTGFCPQFCPSGKRFCPDKSFPLFARGPKSDMLRQCQKLYDIPPVVRAILAESYPKRIEMAAGNRFKRRHRHRKPNLARGMKSDFKRQCIHTHTCNRASRQLETFTIIFETILTYIICVRIL